MPTQKRPNAKTIKSKASSAIGGLNIADRLSDYVTTKQASDLMGVDHQHIAHLLKAGKIQGVKLGHDWIVFLPSLEKYHNTKSTRGRPSSRTPKMQIAI